MQKYEKYRKNLLARREVALGRMNKINRDIHHLDEPLSADFAEQAVERENEEVLGALGGAAQQELQEINRALLRMEQDEYEFCADCGASIPWTRLDILPSTTQCVNCAEKVE